MDYYAILELSKDASQEEVLVAYRRLAKLHHPDLNQGNEKEASARFKLINEAFRMLSDPIKRSHYNYRPRAQTREQPVRDPVYDIPEPPTHDIWGKKLTPAEQAQWVADCSVSPGDRKYWQSVERQRRQEELNEARSRRAKAKAREPKEESYWVEGENGCWKEIIIEVKDE